MPWPFLRSSKLPSSYLTPPSAVAALRVNFHSTHTIIYTDTQLEACCNCNSTWQLGILQVNCRNDCSSLKTASLWKKGLKRQLSAQAAQHNLWSWRERTKAICISDPATLSEVQPEDHASPRSQGLLYTSWTVGDWKLREQNQPYSRINT